MHKMEVKASANCERLRILRSILLQPFTYFKPESNKRLSTNKYCNSDCINTKKYVLFLTGYIMILLIHYGAVVTLLLSVALIQYYAEIYLRHQIPREHPGGGKTYLWQNHICSKTSCK